jgi:hypothetical protein
VTIRPALLVAISLTITACSSPDQKIESAQRSARSWEATLRMTTSALDRGSVTRVYAGEVLQAAREARSKDARQPEWAAIPVELRRQLESAIDQLALAWAKARPDGPRE